jgi:hypothetical protein
MIGAIPNPQKSLQLNTQIDDVTEAIQQMALYTKKYKLYKSNKLMNQYVYEATEFLSFGVYIDISCTSSVSDKTDLKIEIRRKVGAFDKTYEVSEANRHIQNIIELLSETLGKDKEERRSLASKIETELKAEKEKIEASNQEAIQKAQELKENNPIKYYTQQFLILLVAAAILAGGGYLIFKMLQS